MQTYSLNKGIKEFRTKTYQAAHKEIKQLHNSIVFKPIFIKEYTSVEQKQAIESLIFLANSETKNGKLRQEHVPTKILN